MSSTLTAVAVTGLLALAVAAAAQDDKQWEIHDLNRPQPTVVNPGGPGKAPSDAVVLFDGKNLNEWVTVKDGSPATWTVANGILTVNKATGNIETKRRFKNYQLHIEWRAPTPPQKEGQGRGNSGVYLMERYEVQVLDSHKNKTYADGTAGNPSEASAVGSQ